MSSGRSIDHVVLTVTDLERAAAAFSGAGFTLTPRAQHEDRMGTSNQLAQFGERNFIELLELDRPDGIDPHQFDSVPATFSFGAFNQEFIKAGEGVSMIVFQSDNALADCESFASKGLQTYAPFSFDRQGRLPDGSQVTLSFTLAFVTSPTLPGLAFFVCENQAQDAFWKPAFQAHENGATGIRRVHVRAEQPESAAHFVGQLFDGQVRNLDGHFEVQCGPAQVIVITSANHRDEKFSELASDRVVPGLEIGTDNSSQSFVMHGVAMQLSST